MTTTSAPAPVSMRYAWVVVGLLWGVALLNYLDRQMLSTMRPAIMGDIRELAQAEQFGRLMAVFLWIYGLASPMAGLVADRVNRKRLIVGSLMVWSGVTLAMGLAHDFTTLYVLRAAMGLSEALYIPAGLALIADYHQGPTRSLAVGIHMTGLYAGQALGGFGATLAQGYSWQRVFQGFGVAGVLYGVVLALALREHRPAEARAPEAEAAPGALRSMGHSLRVVGSLSAFWVIVFYFAAPSFPGWATKNWLPTLFSERLAVDMTTAGPLATITIAVSCFVGVIGGGLLADRWAQRHVRGRIFTSAIGLSATVPALLLIGFGSGLAAPLGGAVLFGIGYGLWDANNMPILCQFVSPRHRAAAYGLMNLCGVFAGALVTDLLGRSSDAGHLGRDMALLGIPVIAAVTIMLAALRPASANRASD